LIRTVPYDSRSVWKVFLQTEIEGCLPKSFLS
jgi:hypothetical protein